MSIAVEALLSAEDFARLEDGRQPRELVKGKVVVMNVPAPRHGEICGNIAFLVGLHVREHRLGHIVTNDGGVITERSPDTVRGADVSYYSYSRVPPGPMPKGYLDVVPELVFEVRSPLDRWSKLLGKVSDYLDAGVSVVCVVDQSTETVQVYRQEELPEKLQGDEELYLPEILGEFRVRVGRFFE